MSRFRKGATLAGAALIALAAVEPAVALPKPPSGSAGGAGGFSVSGKPGPFIKQISNRPLGQIQAGAGALSLSSDAINRGEFQAARLRMPQTEAKVKALLDRIEVNWPYANAQPVKVMILGVDYYSAQALPDGSIMVGFGLIDRAQSDDELAFVLSHELGHIRLGHFAKVAQQAKPRETSSQMSPLFVIAQASAAADLLHLINDVMVEPAWSRGQEDEADAIGFDLAQMVPYSAESASARVFDTIQADADKRTALSEALKTRLTKEFGVTMAGTAARAAVTGGRPRDMLLQGIGRMALSAAAAPKEPGPDHRPPEARKQGIANYSAEAYPDGLPLRDEQSTLLGQIRATPEYTEAKVAVDAVANSMRLRTDGDYPGAAAHIAAAMRTSFRTAPMVINEAARIRDDMGDAAGADALFIQAHASPDQTVDGYLDHGRMLFRTGQYDRAEQVVDEGTRRFGGDDKPFLSLLVAVADKQGKPELREQRLKRCRGFGNAELKKDCDLAAGGKGEGDKATPSKINIRSLPSLPARPF